MAEWKESNWTEEDERLFRLDLDKTFDLITGKPQPRPTPKDEDDEDSRLRLVLRNC